MTRMRIAVVLAVVIAIAVGISAIWWDGGGQGGEGAGIPSEGVYINPVSQEAEPGQAVTVNVEIKPADWGISGSEITLEFDPAALEATGLEQGGFLGDTPLVGLNEIDNEAGMLRIAVARVGETTPPSPPGVLATVSFTVLDTAERGTHDLTLTEVRLTDENFEDIADIKVQHGSIKVIE